MFRFARGRARSVLRALATIGVVIACSDITVPKPATPDLPEVPAEQPPFGYRDPSTRGDAQAYTWTISANSTDGSGSFNVGGAATYPRPTWVRIVASGYFVRTPNHPCLGGPESFGPYGRATIAWGDGVNNHSQTFGAPWTIPAEQSVTDYVRFSGAGIVHSVSRPPYAQRTSSGVCGDPPYWCGGIHGYCDTWSGSTVFTVTPLQSQFWLAADSTSVAPGSFVTFSGGASPQTVEGKYMEIVGDSLVWIPDADSAGGEATEAEIHATDPNYMAFCTELNPPNYFCRRKMIGSGTYYRSVWVNGKWDQKSVHISVADLILKANPGAVHAGESVTFTPSWSDGSAIAANQVMGWSWTADTPPGSTGACAAGVLSCQRSVNESGTMKVTVTRNGVTRTAKVKVPVYTEFSLDSDKQTAHSGDTVTFTPKLDGVPTPAARWKWVPDSLSDAVACAVGVMNCKKGMIVSGTMWAYLSSVSGQGDSASKHVDVRPPKLQLLADPTSIDPGNSVTFTTSAGGASYTISGWQFESEGVPLPVSCVATAITCITALPDAGIMIVFGSVSGFADTAAVLIDLSRGACASLIAGSPSNMRALLALCEPGGGSPWSGGVPPEFCGDIRDSIIAEYYDTTLFYIDTTKFYWTDRHWKPGCADFTQTKRTVYFSYAELTKDNPYHWAVLRPMLLAPADSGYGLDLWRELYGGSRIVNSGYRPPRYNRYGLGSATDSTIKGARGSRHMFGDAVDLRNVSGTKSEYNLMVNMAYNAEAGYVETPELPCKMACTHADWRRPKVPKKAGQGQ